MGNEHVHPAMLKYLCSLQKYWRFWLLKMINARTVIPGKPTFTSLSMLSINLQYEIFIAVFISIQSPFMIYQYYIYLLL